MHFIILYKTRFFKIDFAISVNWLCKAEEDLVGLLYMIVWFLQTSIIIWAKSSCFVSPPRSGRIADVTCYTVGLLLLSNLSYFHTADILSTHLP